MDKCLLYPVGNTDACHYAAKYLRQSGWDLIDHPSPEVTHLLLDIPSFDSSGFLRSGDDPLKILQMLPQSITIIGGNLEHPAFSNYRKLDLLKDTYYLAQNAAITAECALQVAAPLLKTTIRQAPSLILGWGRIGKCLANLLRSIGAPVTVAARKATDRAMLCALGYPTEDTAEIKHLHKYRIIFNTVPDLVLTAAQTSQCSNCIKIDLASKPGIAGDDVVWARGLPGIYAPEASGALISKTLINYFKEET